MASTKGWGTMVLAMARDGSTLMLQATASITGCSTVPETVVRNTVRDSTTVVPRMGTLA